MPISAPLSGGGAVPPAGHHPPHPMQPNLVVPPGAVLISAVPPAPPRSARRRPSSSTRRQARPQPQRLLRPRRGTFPPQPAGAPSAPAPPQIFLTSMPMTSVPPGTVDPGAAARRRDRRNRHRRNRRVGAAVRAHPRHRSTTHGGKQCERGGDRRRGDRRGQRPRTRGHGDVWHARPGGADDGDDRSCPSPRDRRGRYARHHGRCDRHHGRCAAARRTRTGGPPAPAPAARTHTRRGERWRRRDGRRWCRREQRRGSVGARRCRNRCGRAVAGHRRSHLRGAPATADVAPAPGAGHSAHSRAALHADWRAAPPGAHPQQTGHHPTFPALLSAATAQAAARRPLQMFAPPGQGRR